MPSHDLFSMGKRLHHVSRGIFDLLMLTNSGWPLVKEDALVLHERVISVIGFFGYVQCMAEVVEHAPTAQPAHGLFQKHLDTLHLHLRELERDLEEPAFGWQRRRPKTLASRKLTL